MTLEAIIEKLHALIEELKAEYVDRLKATADELLADLQGSNDEGVEQILKLTEGAVKEFQIDLENVLKDLEAKLEEASNTANHGLESASKDAEDKIKKGFARIFEDIFSKLKGFLKG